MSVIYTEQENGNLKLVAEVEGVDDPALAVDALLDEATRLRDREFVVVVGQLEDGKVVRVTVESDEPIQRPKRPITVSASLNGAAVEEEVVETPKPQRRQTRRSTAKPAAKRNTRKPAAKKPAAKPAAKRGAAKRGSTRKPAAKAKPAAKRGGSPFKRNAKSDE